MTNEFDTYRIYYYTAPQYSWQITLDLYKGNGFAGRVLFMKNGIALPVNVVRDGKPLLHYPISDFNNLLLILALDKPLFITVNAANGIGTISTNSETVGDLDNG